VIDTCCAGGYAEGSRPHSRKLLPSKPLRGFGVKKLSAKAKQVKVAFQKGEGPTSQRTDIAEAWVPLQGAGSDARLLVHLQGAYLRILLPGFPICALTISVDGGQHERGELLQIDFLNASACAGALGERRELARGPLEETARFTQQTLDNLKESSEVPAGVISKLQELGKNLASQLFD
jgi:hypothetical protein